MTEQELLDAEYESYRRLQARLPLVQDWIESRFPDVVFHTSEGWEDLQYHSPTSPFGYSVFMDGVVAVSASLIAYHTLYIDDSCFNEYMALMIETIEVLIEEDADNIQDWNKINCVSYQAFTTPKASFVRTAVEAHVLRSKIIADPPWRLPASHIRDQ